MNIPGRTLTLTALEGIPSVAPGDDLAALILAAAKSSAVEFRDDDILVLAQKIVSKTEGRQVALSSVEPSTRAIQLAAETQKDARVVELILQESKEVIRCRPGLIIVEHRLGLVMANAGIDASNVESEDGGDAVLMLPKDPDQSAGAIRAAIRESTRADIGVVINDSFGRAWRMGTIGTAIGVAGLPALVDMRGLPDRNGRIFQSTEVGVADEVAAAASLLMGQASEGRPAIHIRGFPYERRAGHAAELIRPRQMDLFR